MSHENDVNTAQFTKLNYLQNTVSGGVFGTGFLEAAGVCRRNPRQCSGWL